MPIVRVSPKHQITIPKPIFDELKLKVGDVLEVTAKNGKIMLAPLRTSLKKEVGKNKR